MKYIIYNITLIKLSPIKCKFKFNSLMIASRITQARQEKREIIHKVEVKKLDSTALKKVAENFMLYPWLVASLINL